MTKQRRLGLTPLEKDSPFYIDQWRRRWLKVKHTLKLGENGTWYYEPSVVFYRVKVSKTLLEFIPRTTSIHNRLARDESDVIVKEYINA